MRIVVACIGVWALFCTALIFHSFSSAAQPAGVKAGQEAGMLGYRVTGATLITHRLSDTTFRLRATVGIEVVNNTDRPLKAIMVGKSSSLALESGIDLRAQGGDTGTYSLSGLYWCTEPSPGECPAKRKDRYVTLEPGVPARVSLSITSPYMPRFNLPVAARARNADFTGIIQVIDGGSMVQLLPMSVPRVSVLNSVTDK